MSVTQYIGARYVPIFADPIEWDNTREYEPLTIVIHEGNSYTSRQSVPKGIDISNDSFWALTGNYNAQVEQYRRETQRVADSLPVSDFDNQNTVKDYIDAGNSTLDGKIGTNTENIGTNTENITNLQTVLSNEIEARKLDIEKAHVFDTVADMKVAQNLSVGAICHTNGFHASNDGGAAWYEIADSGTANEMDVIACGNLFAILLTTGNYVMPETVGAYGDGTHDDSAFITRAVELSYGKSRTVMLTKNYLVLETINIVDGSTYIIGNESNGYTDSKIIFGGSGALFNVKNSGFCLRNLKIESNFQDTCAIIYNITHLSATLNANRDSTINDCVFTHFNTAIKASGRNVHVYGCTFTECNYGIEIEKRDPNEVLECRNIFIENCDFHSIGSHVDYDDNLSACVKSDNSALDGYIPYSNVIKNCKCQFSTMLYSGGSYIHIIGNEIFAPNSNKAIIEIRNFVKGNPRTALTIVKSNNVYKQGFSTRFKLTRFMEIFNTILCDIENNTICENCEAECIFISNSAGIVIKNNDFGFNANSLAAQANATGYCSNNINRVSDSVYNSGGLTVENNVTVV